MKNIEDLTAELCEAFRQVKGNPKYTAQAKEMANIAGKILNASRVQLEYAQQRKEQPNVAFLNTGRAN